MRRRSYDREITLLGRRLSFIHRFLHFIRGQERKPRRSPRLPVRVTAQLLQAVKNQPAAQVTLTNISAGGASMVGQVRLRNNDHVGLTVQLHSSLRLELRARVVHVEGADRASHFRYGLRFVGLSQDDYNRLTGFIHDPKHGWQFDAPPPPWTPESG